MLPTGTERDTSITREQLRTFHIGGRGLEHAMPLSPLRPAALDLAGQNAPFGAADLASLYVESLSASRDGARALFIDELKRTRAVLSDLLALDHRRTPAASPAGAMTEFGAGGGTFFDAAELAAALRGPSHGSQPIDTERRARIEATVAVLDEAVQDLQGQPRQFFFQGAACFEDALDFCDGQLARVTAVLRALRLARLDSESAYNAAHHTEALDRFDWQAAEADELLAFPAVVVMETAERLAQASLTAFGRILRSGRPIQILVTSPGLYADDLSGFFPDFGYIAIAHREAFVLQSSLARPEHLAAGFAEMTAVLRPAVAVVAVPAGDGPDARAANVLACLSGAFPLYRYDPDRGSNWAERFQLVAQEEHAVTAADAAALMPEFRRHFRVLPPAAWDDEQIEMGEYLKRYADKPPLAIPFIWVVDKDKDRKRAVVTRELVNLCRDRGRAWRIFEELAGVRNAYVESAVAEAREQARQLDPETERNARLGGATEAIQRVVAMLLQPGAKPASELQPLPAATVAPVPASVAEAVEKAVESEDPYIDSFLCTSCNDCFKVNPRVFNYDANKQAYIADARAGTFAELVKAAEGCPAKCIHPGTPRPDDPTVTPQLLAKAVKLR